MHTLRIFGLLITVLIGLGLAACTGGAETATPDPWGEVTVDPDGTIKIAVVTSGEAPEMGVEGVEHLRGAQLAIERRGTIRGFAMELVPYSANCSIGRGSGLATELVTQRDLVAIIGHTCSASCNTSMNIYEAGQFTAISPTCGADTLTDEILNPGSFLRTMYENSREGTLAGDYAYNELGARRAVVFHDGSLETRDQVEAFENTFLNLGGIVEYQTIITPAQTSYQEEVTQLLDTHPDVIYAPLMPVSAAGLTRAIQESRLESVPIIEGRYSWSNWFLTETGIATSAEVYATGAVLEGETFEVLVQDYIDLFGEQPNSVTFAFAYDATLLALQAIQEAGYVDGQQFVIGRQVLQNTLYNTAGLSGLTGTLTCTPWGDCSGAQLGIGKIQGGEWQLIYVP